ncbi:hypothetical protein [Kitasatospora sp. NPDC096140]|uniref:hypothetical protein n=1 Tax=Kitasatospora sp. NPDC096140 TaxID=3155425 RepID=UPI0033309A29
MRERSELGAGGRAQPHATAAGSGEVNASGAGVTPGRVEASTRWSDAPAERREARA